MDRYYLDKKNVENQFMFYRLIQFLLDECLRRIGMRCYHMNKEFRKRLYVEFLKYESVYVQVGYIQSGIVIRFTLKKEKEEIEFGSLTFESNHVNEIYSLK